MGWFKTIWLTSAEREILRNAANPAVVKQEPTVPHDEIPRPFRSLYFTSGNVTVVMNDGSVLTKSGVGRDEYERLRGATTEQEVEFILIDKAPQPVPEVNEVETPQERKLVVDNLGVIRKETGVFSVQGDQVYLQGVNLAMPASVISSFIEILEKIEIAQGINGDLTLLPGLHDQFTALKMFWLKLALNTLPSSREQLLIFVRKNNVQITRNGNLILYRRIVTKATTDTKLVTIVSQNYYRLKKDGLDTRHYAVDKVGDDYVVINLLDFDDLESLGAMNLLGNLQNLYLDLPTLDTNDFTSSHDKSVSIKLGAIYSIPDNKINLKSDICHAGGLHAAAVDYNYSGYGDLPVVVLVNPSKAITVPSGDTGKLRTAEMFIACVNDKPRGTHFDESALSAFDEEYHDLSLSQLEEAAKTKSFANLSVQDTVPAVSLVDLNQIKEMLKSRIKEVTW